MNLGRKTTYFSDLNEKVKLKTERDIKRCQSFELFLKKLLLLLLVRVLWSRKLVHLGQVLVMFSSEHRERKQRRNSKDVSPEKKEGNLGMIMV